MKHLPSSPFRHRLAVLVAAFGLALLAMPAAHAFTIDGQSNSNSNSDGTARYADPDERFSGSGNGQTTIQQGNATLRFGNQPSFDQRYNPKQMLEPNARPGDDR